MSVVPNVVLLKYGTIVIVDSFPLNYEVGDQAIAAILTHASAQGAVQRVYRNLRITDGTAIALFMNPADFYHERSSAREQLNAALWSTLPPPIRPPVLEVRLQRDINRLRNRGLDLWAEWDHRLKAREQNNDDSELPCKHYITLHAAIPGKPIKIMNFEASPGVEALDFLPDIATELAVTPEDLLMYHDGKIVLPGQTLYGLGAAASDQFLVLQLTE